MHQSIPAAPNPTLTPGLLRSICLPFQSRGWGICKFCAARGPGTCPSRGCSRAFDTHAVSYQNITTKRILLKKSRLAHLSRTGGCKGMFSISMHAFLHCLSSQGRRAGLLPPLGQLTFFEGGFRRTKCPVVAQTQSSGMHLGGLVKFQGVGVVLKTMLCARVRIC